MRTANPVILLELNELTPGLIHRFMDSGALPNFRRLYQESLVFTTDAEEDGLRLNPWVQWVTVHSGLPFSEHGVYLLGEGGKLATQSIFELASDAGRRVWMCGSMNARFEPTAPGSASLPDPWATRAQPQPAELEPFFRFVQHHVLEHTNADSRLGVRNQLGFARFLATHGLSPTTAWSIARQLLRERGGRNGWKRVALLDQLQWDVFRWYYRRLEPHLASFFSNAVAHLQHTHWRELEPERFSIEPLPEQREEFSEAVPFGYRENDRLLGNFLRLAGERATLIFCTALSQQPDVRWEEGGGRTFYRPRDFARFVAWAGIDAPHRCSPVMSEEFWLEFDRGEDALQAESKLQSLVVAGQPAFMTELRAGRNVYASCSITRQLPADAELSSKATGAKCPFFELLYQADTLKSGAHHPDGLLWIRTPQHRHRVHEEKVPLTAIAPTVLNQLGLEIPAFMGARPLL